MNRRKFKALFLGIFALLLAGFAVSYILDGRFDFGQIRVNAKVKEIEGYRNWTKVNAEPELMPAEVAKSCVMLPRTIALKSEHRDLDQDKYFTVFVNETGREAMLTQKNPQFPEGSVIVKEKLPNPKSTVPELLTIMIKLKKGASPETGDWEYMVTDGTGTTVTGRGNLANCRACHAFQSPSDYIFRTYLDAETQKKLK
jgi:hypothetical protein